ncbi:hypothetical protein HYFRA_00002282 [Hymenoscyphus fraxineus]|uniref:Thioredoxin domain-containing protein n=1 Tax=Hymenoscyphus fraxineus TaxID=746836 RepID=A0A9N9L612_9HELO|nr:hypothetical protein HYFRA_00002282 [Hymenoscyphus fraxineus]
MADVEEPQFTSLSARIAALNKQGVAKSIGGPQPSAGKRPPPPPPPARPPLPSRPQTTNNPSIASHGSSVTKAPNNLPNGSMGRGGLLPPPVAQDNPKVRVTSAKTPPLPARRGPPPLPTRKETSPALPARNGSTQLVRRGSNASMKSFSSSISGLSLGPSITSTDSHRKLPPPLDQAKLPPLPPSRHEQTLRKAEVDARTKVPMKTVKSSPNVPLRGPPPVDRDQAPKMPPRPTGPPKMPPRPVSRDPSPHQQQRRLPPPSPAPARSALTMGFGQKSASNPAPRPASQHNRLAGPPVVELDERDFDSVVMAGKPVFIDMYATFCKYCDQLEPIWKELGEKFAFASDRLTIAKLDTGKYRSFMARFELAGWPELLYFDGYSKTPEKCPFMLSLEGLTQWLEEKSGICVADSTSTPQVSAVPPPINLKSKPTRNDIKSIQNRPAPAEPQFSGCLLCRDFSGPDSVAAQYPRQNLPRNQDSVSYLAQVLCGPFRSHTDKARAIFTWLHHNIAYDTVSFFGNTVKHVEPRDNISSGLAVCGGYAGVYVAIALKAGMEAVMVMGHGKGYGHSPLGPRDPIPPCKPDGHAWNAVRIDDGEWKLIDPCWGAGNVNNQIFNKVFTPSYFTMSNDEFGLKHFPQNKRHFFRSDGSTPSWEWYMRGPTGSEPVQLFTSTDSHGLSPTSFSPASKNISVSSAETVRFQFSKMCEHWDHEKNGTGKPYPFVLKIGGRDGRNEDFVAFENNEHWWWCDVPARDLGASGQTVHCYAVTTIDGADARGVSRRAYLEKKGRVGMGFGGVCCWSLVQ